MSQQPPTPPLPPDENFPVPPNNPDNQNESPGSRVPKDLAKLLESVPKEQRAEVIEHLLEQFEISGEKSFSMATMMRFSGPMPHPDILRGMEEIVPGSAKEIIGMSLSQSEHRKNLEQIALKSQTKQSSTGQWLGFVIAIFGLGGAFALVYTGHDAAGSVLGSFDLIGLVSVFVFGRQAQKRDLDKKKDE
ncbi:MAG: DUF2335 domain-containing protein [Puia sp.]|nr:DUF2335 domain-containing protein [Puia sp.]